MQEIFSRIAASADTTEETARTAVGHILAFMQAEGDDPAVEQMIAETPGTSEALGATDGALASGGIMGLGGRLMGLGLDMGQIRTIAETLVAEAKAHAGEDTVNRAIASVPGLGQFV